MATTKKDKDRKVNSTKGTRVAGSMADQIDKLAVGQSIAIAERINIDEFVDSQAINDSLKKQRSGMAAYVARVSDADLDTREFKTESGTYLTDDKGGIITTVTVTRMR